MIRARHPEDQERNSTMPKLKSLRGAVGSYGRVAAGGIVDVDETQARKLLATKRFVQASESDIAAAQKAQKAALAVTVTGATPGFAPLPEKPQSADRLQKMIEAGEITPEEARTMARLQISVSTEEVQALIQREADEIAAQFAAAQADQDARQAELDEREAALTAREEALAAAQAATAAPEAGAKAKPEADTKKAAK